MSRARRDKKKYDPPLTTWERRFEKRCQPELERLAQERIYITVPMAHMLEYFDTTTLVDLGCKKKFSW